MTVRPIKPEDIPDLQRVLDETVLFPSEMLPSMLEQSLGVEPNNAIWLVCETGRRAVGFCYTAAEALADGTWNMMAIAVLPALQGTGIGGIITHELEIQLRQRDARILIAETSSTGLYAGAREFYRKSGFAEEARIREFWGPGDDKIVFWKSLKTG
jgi:ribosomal protein S18 acetylase RimI-like enzyme